MYTWGYCSFGIRGFPLIRTNHLTRDAIRRVKTEGTQAFVADSFDLWLVTAKREVPVLVVISG